MAILGINVSKKNPEFSINDFLFWMPQFKEVLENDTENIFDRLKNIADQKIFKTIYGSDWELAMSLCIAHYLELKAVNHRIPKSKNLSQIAGGGSYKGVTNSMSVGAYSKSIDTSASLMTNEESYFWNQTSYGASLMALLKSKPLPSIFVVTQDA